MAFNLMKFISLKMRLSLRDFQSETQKETLQVGLESRSKYSNIDPNKRGINYLDKP